MLTEALRDGTLQRVHELALPGFGVYITHAADTPRQPVIDAFHVWIKGVTCN